MVYDRENGIESCTRRQCCDKVHSDGLERKGKSSSRYPIGRGSVWAREPFVLLTCRTTLDVV